MNQKIDSLHDELSSHEGEFTRGFFLYLIVLTLGILIFVIGSAHQGDFFYEYWFYEYGLGFHNQPPLVVLCPAMYASIKTVHDGLYAFSDKALTTPSPILTIETLASIIVIYIIIPTSFFFNWRRRRIENKSISSGSPLSLSSIVYALWIILTISIAVTATTSALWGYPAHRKLEQTLSIQTHREKILSELYHIAMDAYQYRLLPKELGGGNGKYDGFALTPAQTKTQNGMYSIVLSENQITMRVQSLLYSSGIIQTTLNEQGETRLSSIEGVFR
jgi:hypothetical protein